MESLRKRVQALRKIIIEHPEEVDAYGVLVVLDVILAESNSLLPDARPDLDHTLEQARRNWHHWQQRAEIAEEKLAPLRVTG